MSTQFRSLKQIRKVNKMNIKRKLVSLKDIMFKVIGVSGIVTGVIGVIIIAAVIASLPLIIMAFVIMYIISTAYPGIFC